MTPAELYQKIKVFNEGEDTIICNLHSACSPWKGKKYVCELPGSKKPVIDFDTVKTKADLQLGIVSRKSVDAITESATGNYVCFVELKSWELLLAHNGTEENVTNQAKKYESDLPRKLTDSIAICQQVTGDEKAFDKCPIIFILVTDISIETNPLESFQSNLTALAGSASNLKMLCNELSEKVMNNIPDIETRYWCCRDFDELISSL